MFSTLDLIRFYNIVKIKSETKNKIMNIVMKFGFMWNVDTNCNNYLFS